MSKKPKCPEHLRSHVIVLPGGCVAAICLTQSIAESLAGAAYPNDKYSIRLATPRDYESVSAE